MDNLSGCSPAMNWDAGDLPSAWQSFMTHCNFCFKGPLKEKSEEECCAYLMIWVGQKGRDIYQTWQVTAEEAKSLDTLYQKYETYVKPKSNKVFARYKFQCRVQLDSESAEQFVTDLKTLVKDCGYEQQDEMVRDRIVCGTENVKVKEKLLSEGSDLTLEKAINVARSYEINQQQLSSMNSKEDPSIHAIKRSRLPKHQNKSQQQGAKPKQEVKQMKQGRSFVQDVVITIQNKKNVQLSERHVINATERVILQKCAKQKTKTRKYINLKKRIMILMHCLLAVL